MPHFFHDRTPQPLDFSVLQMLVGSCGVGVVFCCLFNPCHGMAPPYTAHFHPCFAVTEMNVDLAPVS